MKFVLRSAATAVAVWLTTLLPLGLAVGGGEGEWWTRALAYLAIGAVIVLLNNILKPILTVLALPITILTLGLFTLVISWFILWLASWLSGFVDFINLTVGGFWQTLLAAVLISIGSTIMSAIVGAAKD